jgi:flavorubredoxin
MKVAIIYAPKDKKLEIAAKALGKALVQGGHLVDYVEMVKTDRPQNLTRYDFVYIGSVAEGTFGGKVPVEVTEYLKQCRGLQNVKSAAFMIKRLMGNTKGLKRLMAVMESMGTQVMDFQTVGHPADAEYLGKRLRK